MRIAAICCTYKRPKPLEHVIESFLQQDYPAHLRSLIILDDAGQYQTQERDRWALISLPTRFKTMGEKRNASAALAGDVDAYCVWDDDDIYLPWHMSAVVATLANADYSIPSSVFLDRHPKLELKTGIDGMFHGAWGFRRAAFEQAQGYPFIQSGQDMGLLHRFRQLKLKKLDPILTEPRPSYIYRWWTTHRNHLSGDTAMSYEDRALLPYAKVDSIHPHWDRDWVRLCDEFLAKSSAVA
jgi:glycosyltransferase involved in cell wall biosynthesis